MSLQSKERIKQIRQKSSLHEGGWISFPIGADGFMVDMVSELDLEEQIRLGGNHYVSILENELGTTIKQWYFSVAKTDNLTMQDMEPYITYSGKVTITSQIEFNIIDSESENNLLVTGYDEYGYPDLENNGSYIVDRQDVSTSGEKIIMELYRYNMDNPSTGIFLHGKTISIYENAASGETTINQQITEGVIKTPTENQNNENNQGGNEG